MEVSFSYDKRKDLFMSINKKESVSTNQTMRTNLKSLLAWFSFLARYTRKKKSLWCMAAVLLIIGFIAAQNANRQEVIQIGLYCDNPDAMTETVFKKLETLDDGLYRFYRSSSLDYLQEDISLRKSECGYEFPSDLEAQMQSGAAGCITVYTSPSTVLTAVVNEAIYNAIFQEYAKTMLTDYIASHDVVTLDTPNSSDAADALRQLVDEHYAYEKENTPVFHVVYEEIPKDFYDDQALFQIPLRGLTVLFVMLTALAGGSQYRHDATKGRFLLRRPDEKLFVPFLYSYLPALFLSVAALLSLIISTTAPLNTFLIAEVVLFIVFAALCSLICTAFTKFIRSSIVYDALIPVVLLFCLLYSPVLMDLSDFIPGYFVLSWLAPTKWYFALYNLF